MDYIAGDTVIQRTFLGDARDVLVTERHQDVKNGEPGFDGVLADGTTVWGYDRQVIGIAARGKR